MRRNHFFPQDQHELSTIIEKRELTSQRRSSNGGMGGPNSTIDGFNRMGTNY